MHLCGYIAASDPQLGRYVTKLVIPEPFRVDCRCVSARTRTWQISDKLWSQARQKKREKCYRTNLRLASPREYTSVM